MSSVIIITGVTSGVGKALALKFLSKKYRVIGLARNEEKLKFFESKYSNFTGIKTDIQDSKSVKKSFAIIKEKYERIDLLVNNASVFKMDKFSNCRNKDIDAIIDTNLKGTIYTTLKAIKIMKKSDYPSRIVNIGSVASLHGIENQTIYCASKFGLNGFAEALNQEIIKNNISITTIFPGGINTNLWNEKNPYLGDNIEDILQVKDIVNLVEYISELEPRIILKNITMFPSNEWH